MAAESGLRGKEKEEWKLVMAVSERRREAAVDHRTLGEVNKAKY